MQKINTNMMASAAVSSLVLFAGVLGDASQAHALSFDFRDLTVRSGQTESVKLGDGLQRGESAIFRIRQITGGSSRAVDIVLPRGCRVVETQGARGLTISHDGGVTFTPISAEPSEAMRVPTAPAITHLRLRQVVTGQADANGAILVIARGE